MKGFRTLSRVSTSTAAFKRAPVATRPQPTPDVRKSAPLKRKGEAVAVQPVQFRDPRMSAIVAEVIENLKQSNNEELELRRKYELK